MATSLSAMAVWHTPIRSVRSNSFTSNQKQEAETLLTKGHVKTLRETKAERDAEGDE
jgi:hypothetical protein